jgi:hypothetical protein
MKLASDALSRTVDARHWLAATLAILLTLSMLATPASAVSPKAVAAAVPTICSAAPATSVHLRDVKAASTHGAAVACMARYGIVGGHADGTFRPRNLLSRGQMASLLSRFIETARGTPAPRAKGVPFRDTAGSVHADAIAVLHGLGIATGRTAREYAPQGALTRAQMATFLRRTLTALDVDLDGRRPTFSDVPEGSVHAEAIGDLAAAGIVQGVSDDEFDPNRTLTREQASTLLLRSAAAMETQDVWAPTNNGRGNGGGNNGKGGGKGSGGGSDDGGSTAPADPSDGHDDHTDPGDGSPEPGDDPDNGDHGHGTDPDDDQGDHDHGTDPGDDHDHGDHDHGTDPGDPGEHAGEAVRWHDASSWPSGRVPNAQDDVVVDGHVIVDADAEARTVTVTAGSTLEFAPSRSTQLDTRGNVVIRGTLRMQPVAPTVDHLLRFVEIDETAFRGGGHGVVDSDTGLWFTGQGRAVLDGSDRTPWTRAATSVPKGAHTIELETVPVGWRVGDEIVLTPTGAPGTAGHSTGYSSGRVTALDGARVTLDTPTAHAHPRVNGQWGTEVMNLTRNVRVEGTAGGRAHVIFSHTSGVQQLRNAALRYMGPRQPDGSFTKGFLGRYALHFHHNHEASEGSLVENVVVRQSGHRAFVPHASDGITFRGTIAHDVFDEAYWWDRRDTTNGLGHRAVWERPSNRISYENAVASLVKFDPGFRGYRLAGFELGHGNDLSITGSVAVGVQGNLSSSGFSWPEGNAAESGDPTIGDHWFFEDNVAHNNRVHGIFTWQNTDDPRHIISDTVLYHNGDSGIDHGAYSNRYAYRDMVLYGNGRAGLTLHAQGPTSFEDIDFDGGGFGSYAMTTANRHNAKSEGAALRNPRFRGYTHRAVGVFAPDEVHLDIVNPDFSTSAAGWFHLADHVPPTSVIRVQLADGTAFRVHPRSGTVGTLVPEWNARREAIAPFA